MDRIIEQSLVYKLVTLPEFLKANIIGQDEPIDQISGLLKRSFCRLRYDRRPIARMLFLGPTGVGKTEVAELLTQHIFAAEKKLVRLDMSEYMTQDSVEVLRGQNVHERGLFAVYHDQSGGSGTLLFDEIEKAHPRILDLFLQILSAARFSVATGETLDLSNYVVIATSNIGTEMFFETNKKTDRETLVHRTVTSATLSMRPEIFARFQLPCVFNKLDNEVFKKIALLHLRQCLDVFRRHGHQVECDAGVTDFLFREGSDSRFGARPMQEAVLKTVGDLIADEMLNNGGYPVQGKIFFNPRENRCHMETGYV
jgi:ATP-dependent Clp protease ATP-binding subunit ClpB